jgi:SAM-dependent methyltransferase
LSLTAGVQERETFFGDREHDDALPAANEAFWSALIGHIDIEGLGPRVIMDVGCHSGGLLARLASKFSPRSLIGIEPIAAARAAAAERLAGAPSPARLHGLNGWAAIADGEVDLLVCHEMLYLEPDLAGFMASVRRVLAAQGRAFVVLGCHTENPLWPEWRKQLAEDGVRTYDYSPFEILASAGACGLIADVQPLRRSGWIRYDPDTAAFRYPDAETMFDHHYRHKLVFRLGHDDDSRSTDP